MLGDVERTRGNGAAAEAWHRALAARFDVELAGDLVEREIARGEFVAAGPILLRALAEAPGEPKLRFLLGVIKAEAGHPERARALAGTGGAAARGFAVALVVTTPLSFPTRLVPIRVR